MDRATEGVIRMATNEQAAADHVSGWQQVRERRPGFRRLGLGGFVQALGSALAVWSLLLALIGVGALDFTFFGLQVASHPEPFVINGVALSLPVAGLVVTPLAILGIAGGGGVWLGWSPRLALISCVAWIAFAARGANHWWHARTAVVCGRPLGNALERRMGAPATRLKVAGPIPARRVAGSLRSKEPRLARSPNHLRRRVPIGGRHPLSADPGRALPRSRLEADPSGIHVAVPLPEFGSTGTLTEPPWRQTIRTRGRDAGATIVGGSRETMDLLWVVFAQIVLPILVGVLVVALAPRWTSIGSSPLWTALRLYLGLLLVTALAAPGYGMWVPLVDVALPDGGQP